MEVGICTMRYLYPTYKDVQTCACELINWSNMHIGFKLTVLAWKSCCENDNTNIVNKIYYF